VLLGIASVGDQRFSRAVLKLEWVHGALEKEKPAQAVLGGFWESRNANAHRDDPCGRFFSD